MTDPPPWWTDDPSSPPLTPVKNLEEQLSLQRLFNKSNTNNPFHILDDHDIPCLHKLKLPDASIVYSKHQTVKSLKKSFKAKKNPPHFYSNKENEPPKSSTFPVLPSRPITTNNIFPDKNDFILLTKKGRKIKPLTQRQINDNNNCANTNSTKLSPLKSTLFQKHKSTQANNKMSNSSVRKTPIHPKLVPRTPSSRPEYRDFYPSKLAIKNYLMLTPSKRCPYRSPGKCMTDAKDIDLVALSLDTTLTE